MCPPGSTPATFYFSDLEADNGGWTGTGLAPWEHGPVGPGVFEICDSTPALEPTGAASGVNVWGTNLNGCHANSGTESLLSQTFDFSSLSAPIQLEWFNWYEVFIPFDMAEVIVNGGAPLWEVTTTAATGAYIAEAVDLSAFAGNPSVAIDFRLFATTVVNRLGWYIDDIAIVSCVAGAADTDLSITKTVDNAQPAPGGTVIFTLTVTNNGPEDATGVVATDTLPAGLNYVSNDCGAAFAAPTLTWTIGALANGATDVCNVTVTVDPGATGVLVNGASVTADNADPDATNNDDTAPVTVGGGGGVVPEAIPVPLFDRVGLLALAALFALSALLLIGWRRNS